MGIANLALGTQITNTQDYPSKMIATYILSGSWKLRSLESSTSLNNYFWPILCMVKQQIFQNLPWSPRRIHAQVWPPPISHRMMGRRRPGRWRWYFVTMLRGGTPICRTWCWICYYWSYCCSTRHWRHTRRTRPRIWTQDLSHLILALYQLKCQCLLESWSLFRQYLYAAIASRLLLHLRQL